MDITPLDDDRFQVVVTRSEVAALRLSILEALEALQSDIEFHARVSVSRDDARTLLDQLSASVRRPRKRTELS
jgi:hypothetical protein